MNLKKETRERIIREIEQFVAKGKFQRATDLVVYYKIPGYTITKTRVLKEYNFKEVTLRNIPYVEVNNPPLNGVSQ